MTHEHGQYKSDGGGESPLPPKAATPSEQMLRLVLDSIPLGVFWKDRQSRYLGCNWVVARAFGLAAPEAIIGLEDHHLPGLTSEQAAFFVAKDREVMAANRPEYGIVEPATLADGSTIWMETNKIPMCDAAGRVVGILGTWQNITERKQAEVALRASESRFRSVADESPVMIWVSGVDKLCTWFNKPWLDFTGRTMAQELGNGWVQGVHPEDLDRCLATYVRAFDARQAFRMEYRLRRRDGEYRWIFDHGLPQHHGGEFTGYIGSCIDITERKHLELEHQKFVSLADSSLEFIGMCDREFRPFYVNQAGLRLVGLADLESACRMKVQDYFFPEDQSFITEEFFPRVLRDGHGEVEIRFRHIQTGAAIWMLYNVFNIHDAGGGCIGWATVSRNIHDRKLAEAALRSSEDRLRLATQAARIGIFEWNIQTGVNVWSSELEAMYGLQSGRFGRTQTAWEQLVYPEDRNSALRSVMQALETGEPVRSEWRVVWPDGSVHWIGGSFQMFRDEAGQPLRLVGINLDITDLKSAEAALRMSENRLRTVVEAVPVCLLMVDEDGRIVLVNARAEEAFGYIPDELVGQPIELLVPQSIRERHLEYRRGFLAAPQQRAMGVGRELKGVRKDGVEFPVEVGLVPVPSHAGMNVLAAVVDITARKHAEEERNKLEVQIRHTQKLESLGVLAGGIAHDFNNILTSILGFSDLALMELPNYSSARPLIAEAVNGARKAAELTKQMLAYSGKGRFVVQALNLNDVVEDMVHLLQVSISKKCVLKYHFMADLPSIEADVVQMRQIIMNLIINASDAIGDRSGVIAVTTGAMHCDRDYLSETYLDENLAEGLYVYLEVADTGCGMPEATRARIFDPFFTTKATGRGLGLSAVLGIVRGHRGAIKVYSEPARGTTFKVAIPAVGLPAQLGPREGVTDVTWRGSGAVLVVDDEESVRAVARRMLEVMGFTVLTANDGREGVEVFRRENEKIRLVMLDMTMPHLDGAETFREIRRLRSDVKAILSSGYNEQSATSRFAGKGLAGFIQKPYRYEELLAVVRSVLGS